MAWILHDVFLAMPPQTMRGDRSEDWPIPQRAVWPAGKGSLGQHLPNHAKGCPQEYPLNVAFDPRVLALPPDQHTWYRRSAEVRTYPDYQAYREEPEPSTTVVRLIGGSF